MKILKTILLILSLSVAALAQTNNYLQFKARIGFDDEKERIVARKFSADGRTLTLIGLKSIQTWDVGSAKLIESHAHEIVQLDKVFGTSYRFSPDGSRVVTLDMVGSDGDKKEDRVNAYVYDVRTGKRIAVLERPDMSVRFAFWSDNNQTLVTFSGLYNQKRTEISFWNAADLSFRQSIMIEGYTWHYLSRDGERLFVGNGGQYRVLGLSAGASEGKAIQVYNTRTGALEKEFNAGGEEFSVEDADTYVSPDEKFIAASKGKKIVVWETAGNSKPIYELAHRNPKGTIHLEGFSDDGKYLFAVQDKVKEFYDAATGRLAADVPKLLVLRRSSKYFVPYSSGPLALPMTTWFSLTRYYREENPILQTTTDARHVVALSCAAASVHDLTIDQPLYTVKSKCVSSGSSVTDPAAADYNYNRDVFRLSPTGKLLINFRAEQFVVRDLKTGTILQSISRKLDQYLMKVPKWNLDWDIKGSNALTVADDDRSMLIWEINEN